MGKQKTKKKEKLTTEQKIKLSIEALLAIAALIEAVRWW